MRRCKFVFYILILATASCAENTTQKRYDNEHIPKNDLDASVEKNSKKIEPPTQNEKKPSQESSSAGNVENSLVFTSSANLKKACDNGKKITKIFDVNFPPRTGCTFDQNGNLARRAYYMQARHKETKKISLPAKSVLCELDIKSTNSDFFYDDFFFLAFDKYTIVSSLDHMMENFDKEKNLYLYNWDSLKGLLLTDMEAGAKCVGGSDTTCVIPRTDGPGGLQVTLTSSGLSEIVFSLEGKNEFDLSLITTGDDDDADCAHSDLSLKVTAQYLQ